MSILRAYKTELAPNNYQTTQFEKFAWIRDFVFNLGLREWQRQYKNGERPSAWKLRKQFNGIKREYFPEVLEAPYAVTEAALGNLDAAFQNFFRMIRRGKSGGYPKESSYKTHSFCVRNTTIEGNRVHITHVGWVRLKERGYIPTTNSGRKFGTYVTISRRAGRWFISVVVYEAGEDIDCNRNVVGVDLGIHHLATCSNGKVFDNPKALNGKLREIGRLNKELSRRKRGGKNWHKTKEKLQKAYYHVANIRKHALHEVSSYLVGLAPHIIVLEDLNISGMMKNRHLACAISDVGFYELKRQIKYKSEWADIEVLIADRWMPSSKTCSNCGYIRADLALADRTFSCEHCGFEIDRDLNAAMNLAAFGERSNGAGLPVELA